MIEFLLWLLFIFCGGFVCALGTALARLLLWQHSFRIFALFNDPQPPRSFPESIEK